MARLSSRVLALALLSVSSAYAGAGDVQVKFKCESVFHFTCDIDANGDFSSSCDLIENFFDTYYENKKLKPEYQSQAPLSIPSTTSYQCSDGDEHFSTKTLTIAPGETKTQTVKAATCQPDTIEQVVSFTVVNGPVNVKVDGLNNAIGMSSEMAMQSYNAGTYQVKWANNVHGSTKECSNPVLFSFSVPAAAPPATPAPTTPTPDTSVAPAVPLLPPAAP